MHASNSTPAPIVKGDRFENFQCPRNQYGINQIKAVPYASAVGSLMYAQVCTRLDLAFVTGVLGRFESNPGIDHWKMVKKALRYAQGKSLMLTYRRTDSLEIEGYSDADFAGDVDERKSTSGYVFTLACGAISWKSFKQSITAPSTMVAEYVACYEASGQANWLKKFIPGLRVVDNIQRPLRM